MRRRVKKIMAFLLAFALVMSAAGSGKLTVLAETSAQETAVETQSQSAVQNTEPQGGSGSSGQPEQPLEEEVQTGNTGTENENNGNVSSEQNGQTASVPESSSSVEPSSSESGMTGSSETGATESSSGSESTSESESTTESASESESTTESASETESVTQTEENSEEETTETATETEEETTETETETLTEEEGDGAEAMEYTPESQPEGIHVWAYAKEGTFPEGTKMLVSRLDGSAKEEAGAKLDENGVEYDGFFALDISFEGPDGNKIEPEEGSVEVRFEVDASFLPEEVDTDSLEVQHLDESGNSTNVETVATAAEGSVSVNSDKVKAAFAVESFSTFTITWSEGPWFWETTYFKVTVHYVDENGTEITGSRNYDLYIDEGDEIAFSRFAGDIEGYAYSEARYDRYDGNVITRMVASSRYKSLTFYNGEERKETLTYIDETVEADVYLVYQSDGTQRFDSLQGDRTCVNFYVNLHSEIANSGSGTGGTETSDFTSSVKLTKLRKHPDEFSYIKAGGQYVVIQGATNGSAYEVDQNIRLLGTEEGVHGFEISNFPSDEDVFKTLRELEVGWKDITVGSTVITSQNREQLTTENYAIRWYVFKYDVSDGWHVDGILVPKYGRLTVTKCFDFGQQGLTEEEMLALVPDEFTIQVKAGDNAYSLQMRERTDSDSQGEPGWNSCHAELGKITFTWEVDVLNRSYTISEQNAGISDYSLDAATYQTNLFGGSSNNGNIGDGFTIKCETTGTDSGTTATQSAALTNTYSQSVGDLIISKEAYSALGGIEAETFTFTVNAGNISGTYEAPYGQSDSLNGTKDVVFVNGVATVTLKAGETVCIPKLPIGTSVTVEESVSSNEYTTTYTLNNNEKKPGKSCETVISSDPQKITFFNEKIIAVPTGLRSSGTPWMVMLGTAVVFCFGMGPLRAGRKSRRHG